MRIIPFMVLLLTVTACSKAKQTPALPAQRSGPPPAAAVSLLPDASTKEIMAVLNAVVPEADRSAVLKQMESASKRIYAWQILINAKSPGPKRIRFDRIIKGIPIESPMAYNAETVDKEFADAVAALNPEMREGILNPASELSPDITTPDLEFETKANKVLKAYDHAMRWEALSPYLDYFKNRIVADIRGYYFLKKVEGLEEKLTHWKDVPATEAAQLSDWLIGQCRNSNRASDVCTKELTDMAVSGNVLEFFQSNVERARARFGAFFNLQEARKDVTWFQEQKIHGINVPFTKPEKEDIASLVKGAIEAAWQGDGWQLRIGFTDRSGDDTAHLRFEAGALPHVNGIAGSEITMDDNIPADNEANTNIFQHEFGHVLGFPDCYVEFFDESMQKMVNYQLDVDNIMCSRKGKVTDLHRDELRKAYQVEPDPRVPSSAKRKKIKVK